MSTPTNRERALDLIDGWEPQLTAKLSPHAHQQLSDAITKLLDEVEQAASLNAAQNAWDEGYARCGGCTPMSDLLNPYRNSGGVEASSEDTRKDQPNVPEPDLQAVTTPAAVSSERPACVLSVLCRYVSFTQTGHLTLADVYDAHLVSVGGRCGRFFHVASWRFPTDDIDYGADVICQIAGPSGEVIMSGAGRVVRPTPSQDFGYQVCAFCGHALNVISDLTNAPFKEYGTHTVSFDMAGEIYCASFEVRSLVEYLNATPLVTPASETSAVFNSTSGLREIPTGHPEVDSATPTLNENESPKRNPSVQQALDVLAWENGLCWATKMEEDGNDWPIEAITGYLGAFPPEISTTKCAGQTYGIKAGSYYFATDPDKLNALIEELQK